jgi:CRP/FNR family transcriptional regulator, cyclic AMP receptor protein
MMFFLQLPGFQHNGQAMPSGRERLDWFSRSTPYLFMGKTRLSSKRKAGKLPGKKVLPRAAGGRLLPGLYEFIAKHPLFEGMEARQLKMLADLAMETQFASGEYIFRRQDPANRFYLILEGRVELELASMRDGMKIIQMAGAGDYLGWAWLFEPYSFYLSARTVEPTRAIFFYGTMLRQRCENDHDLGYEIVKRVAQVALQRLAAFQQNFQERKVFKERTGSFLISHANEAANFGKQPRI